MHWFAIAIFVIGAFVQGRVEPFDEVPGRGYTYVASDGVYGIVVDERYAPRFFGDKERDTIDAYWTPAREDIALVEELIEEVRHDDAGRARERAISEGTEGRALIDALVSRQYVGITVDGVNLIKVNGFCSGGIPAHPLQRLAVDDGGACFWRAAINMDTGTIETYSENGVA